MVPFHAKVLIFVINFSHERDKCVYAHNIQDYRRNPKEH